MTSSRLVRGTKTRMFAVICLISVLGAVLYVFHGTQNKLAEIQKLLASCNQQQESQSAQLQVIFEYKVRLEKSLTKEKEDHKQTKETLETKLKEEKTLREKDNQEAKNKYEAIIQQNKLLQDQLNDLKENERRQNKLVEDNQILNKELDDLRVKHNDLIQQADALKGIKADYWNLVEEKKALLKEKEELQTRLLPEAGQRNYFEKQSIQIKEELEKSKKQLVECEEVKRLLQIKTKPDVQPDTNVAEMPKMQYQKTNGSTTPGLNPEAVNNFEVSSSRPLELPVKKEEPQGAAPKKPTQESILPLPQPQNIYNSQGQQDAQIPVPGNGNINGNNNGNAAHDPLGNTLQKPNVGGDQGEEPDSIQVKSAFIGEQGEHDVEQPKMIVPAPDNNRAEEEDNLQKQGEIPRIKNENYRGGDYEREQPEDEEDEEGEQMDYENDRNRKEQKIVQPPMKMVQTRDGDSVMVIPK